MANNLLSLFTVVSFLAHAHLAFADRVPASYRNHEIEHLHQVTEPTTEAPAPQEVSEGTQLTGDWNGLRSRWSEMGVDLALIYKGELVRGFSGGLDQRTVYLENVDLRAALDFEKAFGWKSLSGFVYGLGNMGGDRGHSPSSFVGDAQVTSNIETPTDSFKLYQFWLQQTFFDDRLSLLAGLHDLNSEFYVTETSSLFFNSSFGIGQELAQTGVNGPSIFPNTALAVRAHGHLTEDVTVQVAAFNGQAGDPERPHGTNIRYSPDDGLLWISEFAYSKGEGAERRKFAAGFWTYSKKFAHEDGLSADERSEGFYLLADQNLTDQLAVFGRFGTASPEVNRFDRNYSGGVVYTGLIPSREKDRVGLAFTRVEDGSASETVYEFNYRVEICPGVAVQPDVQLVVNPDANSALSNALVGSFRVELNF